MARRAASTSPSSPPEERSQTAPAPGLAPRRQAEDEELLAAREGLFAAQRHYPHDAGVFVGNLPIRLTDLQLLHEVNHALSRYGECEVMMNRSTKGNGKPWAVVQFRYEQEARNALCDPNRFFIDNRPIRVSRLEAPRAI